MGAGWLEAVGAEPRDGVLVPVGRVKFGLGGKEFWRRLDRLRAGPRVIPASSRCSLRRSPGEVLRALARRLDSRWRAGID